jgi:hypothetical protein
VKKDKKGKTIKKEKKSKTVEKGQKGLAVPRHSEMPEDQSDHQISESKNSEINSRNRSKHSKTATEKPFKKKVKDLTINQASPPMSENENDDRVGYLDISPLVGKKSSG